MLTSGLRVPSKAQRKPSIMPASGFKPYSSRHLSGTRVTEKGIEALRSLKSIRRLNLLGAQATDASMDVLAEMEHLQVVNLYRTGITNAGVARLQGLKELADIDLRYTRVTSNGIEALRAALPNAKVQFVGSSTVRPADPESPSPLDRRDIPRPRSG